MTSRSGLAMRGVALFALFALAVQLLIPPGYMPVATGGRVTLAICTGHGPMQMGTATPDGPRKAPDRGGGHVCAFAGHGASTPVSIPQMEVAERVELEVRTPGGWRDLAPGRGLAAPPPPSQAPPARLA
ncbi:MAG: hypothetical protein KGO51_04055 [Alphaproteobacteria bacterium]|nr:hypothetical protein [Alphaproteobacteria bacterium]